MPQDDTSTPLAGVKQLPKETWQEISDLLLKNRKIEAIKIYREQSGVGLKESKEAVEAFERELARQFPDQFKNRSGCAVSATLLLLAVLGVGAAAAFA